MKNEKISIKAYIVSLVEEAEDSDEVSALLQNFKKYDAYSYKHSRNVAGYAVAVGVQLGLGEDQLYTLATAGLLHDVGKAAIPEEILKKPGRLTEQEFSVMKTHAVRGYEMVKQSLLPSVIKKAVLYHHENVDGTGYYGKTEKELSTVAKILHVVDVYDALVSKRCYKEGKEPSEVMSIMKKDVGHMFDGKIVATLEEVVAA